MMEDHEAIKMKLYMLAEFSTAARLEHLARFISTPWGPSAPLRTASAVVAAVDVSSHRLHVGMYIHVHVRRRGALRLRSGLRRQ